MIASLHRGGSPYQYSEERKDVEEEEMHLAPHAREKVGDPQSVTGQSVRSNQGFCSVPIMETSTNHTEWVTRWGQYVRTNMLKQTTANTLACTIILSPLFKEL